MDAYHKTLRNVIASPKGAWQSYNLKGDRHASLCSARDDGFIYHLYHHSEPAPRGDDCPAEVRDYIKLYSTEISSKP